MDRRTFLTLPVAISALPRTVAAQGAARVARIGWLTAQREPSLTPFIAALRGALVDLGHAEGRNLLIEYRYGDDDLERIPALAADLLRIPVELILGQGVAVAVLAKLSLPVPLVFITSSDPVSAGLADSLARPRGNMTGITFMAAELNGKRLELLRDIVPGLQRVAVVANPTHPGEHLERDYTREYGRQLGLRIEYYATRTRDELERAFAAMSKTPPQAISLFGDGFAVQYRQDIIDFGLSRRIPVVSAWPVFARSGALFAFGPHLSASYRRLAYYVDRILKGTRPADLPIEQPTRFELVVNLRTARTLGLKLPSSVMLSADEVIE